MPTQTAKLFPRDKVVSPSSGAQQQYIYYISMPKQSVYRHKYNMYLFYYKWKKFAVHTNVFNAGLLMVASRTHDTPAAPVHTCRKENIYTE